MIPFFFFFLHLKLLLTESPSPSTFFLPPPPNLNISLAYPYLPFSNLGGSCRSSIGMGFPQLIGLEANSLLDMIVHSASILCSGNVLYTNLIPPLFFFFVYHFFKNLILHIAKICF